MGKTKSKKYNRSKQTSRSKQSKTQSKRKYKLKGGKFFGQGAFGSVFGVPRLPCSSKNLGNSIVATTGDITTADPAVRPAEDIDEIQALKEVSKVFPKEFNINLLIEFDVIRRLREHISGPDLDELSQILVLPTKKCEINHALVEQNINYYNPEWSNRQYRNTKPNMIIYPTKSSNLHSVVNSDTLNDFNKVVIILDMLKGVFRGIQLLQKYNFIHGDLKSLNVVLSDDQTELNIIDLTDVRHIPSTHNMLSMPSAYMYYTWPSIVAYSIFFKGKNRPIKKLTYEMLYNNYNLFNDLQINNHLDKYLYRPLNITLAQGFSPKEIEKAHAYRCELIGQKLFNYGGTRPCSASLFMQHYDSAATFVNELARNNSDIAFELSKMTSWFTPKSVETQKLDLLKRVDIYSLGILLLECVEPYISSTTSEIPPNIRLIILKIYDLAYFCCLQGPNCVSIDEVVDRYHTLLDEIVATEPAPTAAPGSGSTPAPSGKSTPTSALRSVKLTPRSSGKSLPTSAAKSDIDDEMLQFKLDE